MNKRVKIDIDTKTTKRRTGKGWICVMVAFALLGILTAGGIYAKYMQESQAAGHITSPEFYFTSNMLSETANTYKLNSGSGGTTEITFEVRNYADEYRIADKDIEFTVNVSPSDGVSVKVGSEVTNQGTLAAPSASSASITVSGLMSGEIYDISVTGNAGFSSTLRAKITVENDDKGIYKYTDSKDTHYVTLTVWTGNISGAVNISIPKGLVPDATDDVLSSVYNYNGEYNAVQFKDSTNFTEGYSSHVYRFFKTAGYSGGAFTVTLGDRTATEAIPQ